MQLPFRVCAHPLVVVGTHRSALFHRRVFSRRLNDLLDVLRKLKLVGCQEEVPTPLLALLGPRLHTRAVTDLIFSLLAALITRHTTHGTTRHATRHVGEC